MELDEIDAVGRHRGAGLGGGNDEREQTLNQLLVELDGFGPNEDIVVIGATNRLETLDPAVLRPGRFTRKVHVALPDREDRAEILAAVVNAASLIAMPLGHGAVTFSRIGHFTAANYDPIAYIKEHHSRISNLHLKDRKKNHGANLPWGQGDTPIKEVLQLLKKEKYAIPANIEYEYMGKDDPVTEVGRCIQYCKEALA